jgi:hypothetical protein
MAQRRDKIPDPGVALEEAMEEALEGSPPVEPLAPQTVVSGTRQRKRRKRRKCLRKPKGGKP